MILKSLYFLLFIGCLTHSVLAQNIITNGDMEIYTSCPVSVSSPGNPEIQKCTGWYLPTFATSDFYNACAVGTIAAIPNNATGYQYPQSGNGYLGFLPYGDMFDWYEYITNRLSRSMNVGEKFHVSCYMALANCYYATKEIGFYFHPDSFYINNTNPLPFSPHYKLNYYITDTLVWQKVEFDYIASGGEKYMTLGYFADYLDTLRVESVLAPGGYSYYYVDNFEIVYKENVLDSILATIPNVFTPNNDGINDVYQFTLPITLDYFIIYNRWGTELYRAENISTISWDGENCSNGVYYYAMGINTQSLKSGFIQLFN